MAYGAILGQAVSGGGTPSKIFTASIGTTWTEDSDTGVKSQFVALTNADGDTPTGEAGEIATVDHSDATVDVVSPDYATFVEEENQYLTYITNGYAQTVAGGINFYIFGDPNTIAIPIIVEVV